MKISRVESHVLLDVNYESESTSSAQDDIIVEIHTDEGLVGYGESDVNPWIAEACIHAPGTHTMGLGLADILLGRDPLAIESIWQDMYTGSAMNGRRGAVIHAMGALDMALHDLRGKILGRPCYELLDPIDDDARRRSITPYASLQPEVSNFEEYREVLLAWAIRAKAMQFRAAKLEITPFGPYAHRSLRAEPREITRLIGAVRDAVGDDFTLMVDLQYAFPDADSCLALIRDWVDFNLFFIETPITSDDLAGYARLAVEQPIPIAAGEWLSTRFEFLELMDRGLAKVVQPDVGRVGGLTEAHRVCRLAAERGRIVVPHAWKTNLSITATAHLAAVTPNCAFIEYLPAALSESALRRELVETSIEMVDGRLELSREPGLGIHVNQEALLRFEETAAQQYDSSRRSRAFSSQA